MRSWKTVVSRGICAMFGNRCCSLLHHPLFPMEIISAILIILITINNGTQVEAIQSLNSFPSSSSSSSSSTVISSDRYGSEDISAGIRIRRNASDYFIQRLHALRQGRKLDVNIVQNDDDIRSKQRFVENDILSIDQSIQNNDDRFLSQTITTTTTTTSTISTTIVEDEQQQQQLLQQQSKLLQQTQNIELANSPSISKLIPSNFPRLKNRQDCNDSDCLKNNDAISLYIPQDNSTSDGQLPPLLLLSNNPSNINSRRDRNPQQGTTLKLSKLHTGIKVLESDVQQFQKPVLLPPSSDPSYHISQMNSRNHGEYTGVKLTEVGPIPPFAGGAELTDFIQPLDTTLQTHRIYENIIPNHISSNNLYAKNKYYLLSAPGNRGIYNDFHSVPLIPFNPKLGIYESVTTLPSIPSIHSTYSAQIINHPTLLSSSSLHYGSQYDLQSSVTQDAATSEDSFNSRNTDINTYPSVQLTTTNYETQLADGKNLGPAPPAAMPIIDYSDEQKQIADINFDSTEQNSRVSTDCANIMTTVSVENDETNYAANIEYTFATTSEPIITDTTATSTVTPVTSPCLMQIPHENQQTFPVNAISTISINEILLEEGRSTTIENTAEKYDTTTTTTLTTTDLELVDDHSSSIKFTIKPLLAAVNNTTLSLHQTTIIPKTETESEIEMKHKMDEMEIINKNSTIISQPLQISTLSYPSLSSLSPSLSSSLSSFNIHNVIETTSVPLHSTTVSTGIVLNRLRGKARLICKEDGLQFEITTLFPFTGQIFAHNRKPAAECYFTFNEANLIRVTMPYSTCGMRNSGEQRPETQYHMQIIVIFQQKDNTSTMQSFLTQCVHQKVQYQKQIIPKHIEEALEELRLIPMKLEHKAQIPECMMRIVTEEEHGHGDDGTEVDVVNLGQPMRIEWSLLPESDAYGFHVRNCTVRDTVSNDEYMVIDERGCSTDINIFSHPHYDTYHDTAQVHWHAFKVPDINQLNIKCSIEICTDIPDTISGLTSCDSIPSPPFCPDLITSATNALLSDQEVKVIRKRREHKSSQQHVYADICFGDKKDEYCNSKNYRIDHERHINMLKDNSSKQYCLSRLWLTIWTGLSALTALLAISVYGYCRYSRRPQQYGAIKLAIHCSKVTVVKQQQQQ